jgi:tripartite-type tricarboxylate transporter receptor subunit TctC
MVPAGTPPAIVARLNTEINAILKRPDIVQKMQGLGFELIGGPPEQFGALIRADVARLTPVVKAVGLKVD